MTETKTDETYLSVAWSVSRGRDTYGYNICTVTDESTGKKYRCNGGGYDLLGTSFGEWLQDRYQRELVDIKERAHGTWTETTEGPWERMYDDAGLYGMGVNYMLDGSVKVTLDGACGESSMRKIADALELNVRATVNRKGHVTGYLIS